MGGCRRELWKEEKGKIPRWGGGDDDMTAFMIGWDLLFFLLFLFFYY